MVNIQKFYFAVNCNRLPEKHNRTQKKGMNSNISKALILIFLFISTHSWGQVIADGLPGCLAVENMVGVGCDGGTTFYGINGSDQFQVQNVDGAACCDPGQGGDWNSYFEFEEIDISCFSDIEISMDYSASTGGSGGFEDDSPGSPLFGCTNTIVDNSHDQIVFTYILDGGAEVQSLYVHGETQADFTGTWTEGPLNGNTLRIRIYASNKATAEIFYFENLEISATIEDIDAGPDMLLCDLDPVNLAGSGEGTWSGGLGVFSDINSPTSTYTPDASENNSTVILTYTGCSVCSDYPEESDMVELTFTPLTADPAGPLNVCDDGSGSGIFDLTSLDGTVNGGSVLTVNWYSDAGLTTPIADPSNYSSSGGFVFATVTDGTCESEAVSVELILDEAPTYHLSGDVILCPGDCEDVIFYLEEGSGTYDLDISITFSGIPINFTMPSVMTGVKIEICYDGTGILPTYDAGSMVLTIPTTYTIDGTVDITGMNDANDPFCEGVSDGQISALIDLLDAPEAGDPDPLTECDEGGGFATFTLSDADADVLNGGAGTVMYYSNMDLTNEIFSPYNTMTTTVYAVVDDGVCVSEPVELDLEVILEGDAGNVYITCEPGMISTFCTICDIDGVAGETFSLYFHADVAGQYNIVLEYVIDGTPQIANYNDFTAPGFLDDFNITQVSTFTLISVEHIGVSCPDESDLGDPVVINYVVKPDIDEIGPLFGCDEVVLPNITGSNFPTTPYYYEGSGGTGSFYSPGDIISTDALLYVYTGLNGCEDEIEVVVDIIGSTTYDQPENVLQCGSYVLQEITGSGVGTNTQYFTEPDGGGVAYPEGYEITQTTTGGGTITLFIFDPTSDCATNEPFFTITLTEAPVFSVADTVLACSQYILSEITGMDLSGSEYYSTESGGLGDVLMVGDTIMMNDTIYVFDSSNGCEVTDSIIVEIEFPINVGEETFVKYCEGYDESLNFMTLLMGDPELGGFWSDTNDTGIDISDSTSVDISTLGVGIYNFEYANDSEVCSANSAGLIIQIENGPDAGKDTTSNYCASNSLVFNLNTFVSVTPDDFFDNEEQEISDPASVDLSNMSGQFEYYHVVSSGNSCMSDSSLIVINIQESNMAGDEVSTNVCIGTVVELSTLLQNNNGVGVFEDLQSSGGLSGSQFDSDGLLEGIYDFNHIILASGNCEADTSLLHIQLSSSVSAGEIDTLKICFGDVISLFEGLIDEDAGGEFYQDGNAGSVDSEFDSNNYGLGQFDFKYVVGDDIVCPKDSQDVAVIVNEIPEVEFMQTDVSFCPGQIPQLIVNNNGQTDVRFDMTIYLDAIIEFQLSDILLSEQNVYDVVVDEGGVTELAGNEIILNQYNRQFFVEITNISNDLCEQDIFEQFMFEPLSSGYTEIDTMMCNGEFLEVGNDTYDELKPNGTTILTGFNGCDSIVYVNIQFMDAVQGPDFLQSVCNPDTTFTIGDQVFDINTPSGVATISNGSVAGCDSIVNVTIIFNSSAVGPEEVRFSCDPSEVFDFDGYIFDIDNPSGTVLLEGMASNGCDSTYTVNINYESHNSGIFEYSTCDLLYSVEIGNTMFDISKPSGQVTLEGMATNGCDSIVDVNISFTEFIVDIEVEQGDCNGSIQQGVSFVESTVDGVFQYEINGSGVSEEIENLPYFIELLPDDYKVLFINSDGCKDSISFTINENQTYDSEIVTSVISENYYELGIETDGEVQSLLWTPSFGLSCVDCSNPTVAIQQESTYTVTITYEDGCSEQLSIILEYTEKPEVSIPNIFTPNGDGHNETFTLDHFDQSLIINQFRIYDRWGSLVYSVQNIPISDSKNGWDGKFNGKNAETGVYVYYIELINPLTEVIEVFQGDLTLLR